MGVFLPEIELPLDYRDRDFFGGVFEENLLLRHKKKPPSARESFLSGFFCFNALGAPCALLGVTV